MKTEGELSKAAKAALLDYKAARSPSQAASAEALARVEQRVLDGQVEVDWDTPPGPAASAAGGGLARWFALGGVAVAIGAGALLLQPEERAPEPGKPGVAVKILPPEEPAPSNRGDVVVNPPVAIEDAIAEPVVDTRAAPKAVASPPRPSPPSEPSDSPKPESSSPSTLREEMALLSRGQSAFNSGNYAAALTAFDEHRSRFPAGALASERELKRIATLCRMGRTSEARDLADRFASRRPGSPSAEKAKRICAEAP